jgi:hypothetical protein
MSDTDLGRVRLIVTGSEPDEVDAAVSQLTAVTSEWGEGVSVASAGQDDLSDAERKVVDPVSLAALIISIPSALLAVHDLADRIAKRRRAADLASNAPTQDTTARAYLVIDGHLLALDSADPDQLLDLVNQTTDPSPH